MNVHARARASAQAIDRSATRLDPGAGLDDLLRRHRRQPLQRAAAAAGFALLIAVVVIWAGIVLCGPTPIQPTLGPVTRIRVGSVPVSVAVTPDAVWVLNSGDTTISRIDPGTAGCSRRSRSLASSGCAAVWRSRQSRKDDCGWSTGRAGTRPRSRSSTCRRAGR
jgi:streptogramin lyase